MGRGMSGNQGGCFSRFSPSASDRLVTPEAGNRPPARVEVPKKFADEHLESCLVIADSLKAPPRERRCLQNHLREITGVKPRDPEQIGNASDDRINVFVISVTRVTFILIVASVRRIPESDNRKPSVARCPSELGV